MRKLSVISLILVLTYNVIAAPADRKEDDPELTAGYFEGDMIVSPMQRNGLRNEASRWPDGIVYYNINSDIDNAHRQQIKAALSKIAASSCLIFREASEDQKYYVNITSNPRGCYTAVGFQNKVQQMNLENYPLGQGCYRIGTIMHEMLHALGFYHEQSSEDRDDYVRIAVENIQEGKEHNFDIFDSDSFDQPYDYSSVMHYSPYGFSKNGEMTIVPYESGAEKQMGQRLHMTETDIKKLNIMYKCPLHV